jgi:hypothetical protein
MNIIARSATIAAALLFAPLMVSAQTVPKAEEIFARHVAAMGGKEAVMKVSSIKSSGTLQMQSQGITANVEAMSAAPNHTSTRISIPGIGDFTSGYDGSVAWTVDPMRGPRIKTEKERVMAMEEADFYGAILFSPERFQSAETVGPADFGGQKTWQVKTVLKSGRVANEYFSVETGLKVGSQTTQESAQGTVDVVTMESDYKQFGALKLPTKNEIITGPQKTLLTINTVELSAVPASAFALPEPIKALVKP